MKRLRRMNACECLESECVRRRMNARECLETAPTDAPSQATGETLLMHPRIAPARDNAEGNFEVNVDHHDDYDDDLYRTTSHTLGDTLLMLLASQCIDDNETQQDAHTRDLPISVPQTSDLTRAAPQRPLWPSSPLRACFDAAVEEAEGHPIIFNTFSTDPEAQQFAEHVAFDAAAFYVGATMSPSRRWLGGESERGAFKGHCEQYDRMHVFAMRYGRDGAQLESACINALAERFPETCRNKARDSRGQVRSEVNFIYIVVMRWDVQQM